MPITDAQRLTPTEYADIALLANRANRRSAIRRNNIFLGGSNGPPPSTPPKETPDINSTKSGKKGQTPTGTTPPPGNNDGTTSSTKDSKDLKNTISHSSNTWTTIKFLGVTGISAIGSFSAHFTNVFGEGTLKNSAQIGFDFLTTLGVALTGASALSTYGTDGTGVNTISAN